MNELDETYLRMIAMLDDALGPKILEWLYNADDIVEIMLNDDGRIWIDRLGVGCVDTKEELDEAAAERIISVVASSTESECNRENPILSAELPKSGARFEAIIPPAAKRHIFSIRKKAIQVFSLDNYVEKKIMTSKQKERIMQAVYGNPPENICVAGGTSSGKTTLTNAILAEISKTEARVLTMEDVAELQCTAANKITLRTTEYAPMRRIVKSILRLRPDRIVIGEVRDGAALELLKSMNTGHPGSIFTIHSNSALEALYRLEDLIAEESKSPQQRMIGQAIDLIIFIEKDRVGNRKVKEIAHVKGFVNGEYVLEEVV
ncbi:type ii secretion system protein e [Lucifera butyrica]|uniref:Type ii secretion system protein e n=1 Tax=Lucifera butyrica TaxID=1351585 RepID=A0A498REE1_9FIRM|nr:P-type conjugative transfer ATPase TrbB [Lucifera butyrica]VBB08472.1 type ii secretion system protein e [Lucifera butyrica]